MPILTVEIVTHPDEYIRPELTQELANRTSEIFSSAPGTTWVKVYLIAQENYAENITTSEEIFPVFVSIIKTKMPSPDFLQVEVTKLTVAIAQICGRPEENIHIIYLPEGIGRVAFGGKVQLN